MFREGPVKTLPRWLLVIAICLTVGQGMAPAKLAKPPRVTALVADADAAFLSPVSVIGGHAACRGWVGSADAKGLMHKGDRLILYTMRRGRIGSARLTDDGYDLSRWNTVSPPSSWEGLGYGARLRFAHGRGRAGSSEAMLAVWHASGSPEPRWVPAKVLDPESSIYRKVLAEWLRQQGVSKQPERGLTVRQIVRTDANGDGREEVFLSFGWSERVPSQPLNSAARGGLLMRYLPPGSDKPRMMVVLDKPGLACTVAGLCDLDRDGWAEVVVQHAGQECGGTCLCHWTGRGFEYLSGYSGGE